MAHELKIATAARQIARELNDLPAGQDCPFGEGFVFQNGKVPCCVIGHVIQRAGLSDLVKSNAERLQDGSIAFRSSNEALTEIVGEDLPDSVARALGQVVWANDHESGPQVVAEALYVLANALEEIAAPVEET